MRVTILLLKPKRLSKKLHSLFLHTITNFYSQALSQISLAKFQAIVERVIGAMKNFQFLFNISFFSI
jgi:hypothetical protein